ncbi:hypothetical protein C8T65DRAFT_655431 [Cerioporus squamosus]|nr:hypothetical protein C8T65DRAFT_655431 [Cerioporus squamosus]
MIEVSIYRVHELCTYIPFTPAKFDTVKTVLERSKNAGAHDIAYVLAHHEPIRFPSCYDDDSSVTARSPASTGGDASVSPITRRESTGKADMCHLSSRLLLLATMRFPVLVKHRTQCCTRYSHFIQLYMYVP